MNIYKLLLGAMITIACIVLGPFLAVYFGFLAPLADKAWVVLLVAAGGLVIKGLVGDIVSGEFLFYKFGYDNCVMTLGASLTALGLQLGASADLFPGMSHISVFASAFGPANGTVSGRSIELLLVLIAALVATLITGRIAAEIRGDRARGVALLSLVNNGLGLGMLGLYVLILITKG